MKRLAIIGAGDLGQLIAYHAVADNQFDVIGHYDDFEDKSVNEKGSIILGKLYQIEADYKEGLFDCLLIGIGYKFMDFRKSIFEKYSTYIPFCNLIHSSSYVDVSVKLGNGIFILPGCTIDKDVILGNNVLINTAAIIAHDTIINSHCFIAPGASIAGKTIIEECCIIGINSTIIDNITIAPYSQIAGGAVVINNIAKAGLYLGVPAKIKKTK